MSERSSVGRKLQEPLSDWTFTPAMQQRVLDRIKEPAPPSARRTSSSMKTLAWTAAAAAVFVLGINVVPRGNGNPVADTEQAGSSMQALSAQAATAQESAPPEAATSAADMTASALQADPHAANMRMVAMAHQLEVPTQVGHLDPLKEEDRQGTVSTRLQYSASQVGAQQKAMPVTAGEDAGTEADQPISMLASEPLIRWSENEVTAHHREDDSLMWAAQLPPGHLVRTVSSAAGRHAVLAEAEAGTAVWLLDDAGGPVYAASFAAQILDLALTDDGHLEVTLGDHQFGLIRINP